ncbi:putative diguanylate cyclase (GGDEF domain protein) [Desulfamplus magnetovallimortis]|uniref:diguanylate cyclase n=1 Tax=Desulfamplus magnetovallimortis TaxID=1246637 RepID=A0A1W1HGD5_9BACT|nr:GGDEF domain-containing protein [Desulfamplus magnetovallimortis]SLM31530.1 putative diguanylate cyclase (GGDEF domain protein) [Desulfamplus magnetovallimortis]
MKVELKKIFQVMPLFFNALAREAEHKKLTRHIINLNQQNSTQAIINEMSVCLKDILNYRLFAFVIQRENGIDVWLDPRMYRKSLEAVLMEDFQLHTPSAIHYMNHTFHVDEQEQEFNMENLLSYYVNEGVCQAKIYMLPNKDTSSYSEDIIHMLLQSTAIALAKQMNIEQLTNAATIDPLTGCYNRREFESQIKKAVATAKRQNTSLSLFMFDIDHFKKVNDTYGHQAGDTVLKEVAALVQKNIRSNDVIARYGGEEFIGILPATEKRKAMELADRLRQAIEAKTINTDVSPINVTASFGVATITPYYDTTDFSDILDLIEEADSMMYKAKLNGRNTVMPGLLQVCGSSREKTATATGTI